VAIPCTALHEFYRFMNKYLTAFTGDQMTLAAVEMNRLVRSLQGRKVEEDDWTNLYCKVKDAPHPGWSNLPFRDYLHDGVGVEFKLMKKDNPSACMGRSIMHPAATRTISFSEDSSAAEAMDRIFDQWGATIADFETRTRATSSTGKADLRWGVLLWAPDHSEFLYFEERLEVPLVSDHHAVWHEGNHRGKPTRNLRIYDRATDALRFSCTLPRNGAKLQPYFDVPDVDNGACVFKPTGHGVVPLFAAKHDAQRFLSHFPDEASEEGLKKLLDLWEATKQP
jgi:hypothetical protein